MKQILLLLLSLLFLMQGVKAQEERDFDDGCYCEPIKEDLLMNKDLVKIDSCFIIGLNYDWYPSCLNITLRMLDAEVVWYGDLEPSYINSIKDLSKGVYIKGEILLELYSEQNYFNMTSGKVTLDDLVDNNQEIKDFMMELENKFGTFDIFLKGYRETGFIETHLSFNNYTNYYDLMEFVSKSPLFYWSSIIISEIINVSVEKIEDTNLEAYYSLGNLYINAPEEIIESVKVYDVMGNIKAEFEGINKIEYQLNNLNYPSGIYFALINNRAIYKFSVVE